ncbi:MAG: radical SAM protein [Spirochaetales bacterium]|nr:radical SAM protein [Spirochaetales bacterium]
MILESAPDIHYTFEIRAEHIDEEMAYLFSQLYCSLQIGLQSIHLPVLEKINRTFHSQEFFDHVLLLHHEQIPYGFDLIYGLPEDSLDGFLESLDFTFSMIPNHIDIFPLSVLPGTEIYDNAESYQLHYSGPDYTVTHTPTFSEADMAQAGRVANSVDRFYNQGKAVTWFDILLTYLDLRPSEFFTLVCNLNPEPSGTDILEYQLLVVEAILQELQISGPWLTIKETIRYFWLSNNVLSSAQDEGPFFGAYTLNPQLQLGTFDSNPLEIVSLLENGIQDFDELTRQVSPCRVYLAVYEADGEIQHYECTLGEYELLEAARSRNEASLFDFMKQPDSPALLTHLEALGLVSYSSSGTKEVVQSI